MRVSRRRLSGTRDGERTVVLVSGAHAWALVGEAVVVPTRRARGRRLPGSLKGFPLLPALVVAARWQSSPVGRFDEVSVLEPALVGLRLGWVSVAHGVSVPDASAAFRAEWSLPANPATIAWSSDPSGCTITWEEESLRIAVTGSHWAVPALIPLPLVHGGAGPFRVPQRLRGLARRATADISCEAPDSDLSWLAGRHRGLLLRSARLAMLPRRASPGGALQSLRLQLPAGPEPAARAVPGTRTATVARSGALSSVG